MVGLRPANEALSVLVYADELEAPEILRHHVPLDKLSTAPRNVQALHEVGYSELALKYYECRQRAYREFDCSHVRLMSCGVQICPRCRQAALEQFSIPDDLAYASLTRRGHVSPGVKLEVHYRHYGQGKLGAWGYHFGKHRYTVALLRPRYPTNSLKVIRSRFKELRKTILSPKRTGRALMGWSAAGFERLESKMAPVILLVLPVTGVLPASRAFVPEVVGRGLTADEARTWLADFYAAEADAWATLEEFRHLLVETKGRRRLQALGDSYGQPVRQHASDFDASGVVYKNADDLESPPLIPMESHSGYWNNWGGFESDAGEKDRIASVSPGPGSFAATISGSVVVGRRHCPRCPAPPLLRPEAVDAKLDMWEWPDSRRPRRRKIGQRVIGGERE